MSDLLTMRKRYMEIKKSRGLFSDGYCPECNICHKRVELFLNKGNIFECPDCHLLISLETPEKATILRRRGSGNFMGAKDPYYSGTRHINKIFLSRENRSSPYESDGSVIKDSAELKSYLTEIIGIDSNC